MGFYKHLNLLSVGKPQKSGAKTVVAHNFGLERLSGKKDTAFNGPKRQVQRVGDLLVAVSLEVHCERNPYFVFQVGQHSANFCEQNTAFRAVAHGVVA